MLSVCQCWMQTVLRVCWAGRPKWHVAVQMPIQLQQPGQNGTEAVNCCLNHTDTAINGMLIIASTPGRRTAPVRLPPLRKEQTPHQSAA